MTALSVGEAIADLNAGERDLRAAARLLRTAATNITAPRSRRRTGHSATVYGLVTVGLRHVAEGLEHDAKRNKYAAENMEPLDPDEIVNQDGSAPALPF